MRADASKEIWHMQKAWKFIANLFGFNRLEKYENDYLHDSNIKSSGYMAFIVILLEIWLVLRQAKKYIIPKVQAGAELWDTIFKYTSIFWLFMIVGLGVMLFCFFYKRDKHINKAKLITLIVCGVLCIVYSFFFFKEPLYAAGAKYNYLVMNGFLLFLYAGLLVVGISIIVYAIFDYKGQKIIIFEHIIITLFTLICLAFGFRVSYSDLFGNKEIICFLTMVIYVACLLIYRPFITLLLIIASFISFYFLIDSIPFATVFPEATDIYFKNFKQALFQDGDKVNYITFAISLITICFAIYHGRLNEARKTKALEKSAKFDELTGLFNYQYFTQKALEGLQDGTYPVDNSTFLYIDIHNFKAYNDQHGFVKGNNFLNTMANTLRELFSDSLYARQADDHFVVLAQGEVESKLAEVNRRIRAKNPDLLIGIISGGYKVTSNIEDPRRCIDRARYAARLIKNQYEQIYIEYDKKMDEAYHKRLYVINNIDNAVNNGWIRPFYQPVVWSDSKELCGCEALARWIDPTYGQLYPNEFIPVLEEYRLIHKLDRCIFESVCRDLRYALDNKQPVVPISLNFSRLDFELMDAVSELEDLMQQYNLDKHLVHVEITESALIDSFDVLNNCINRFKTLGYSLWLDDFGSGYSSLNVLKDYEFDVLKIDMKFLSNFEDNPKSKVLIDCIIHMANRINMLTLTEGVEATTEAEFLRSVGCDRLQGYLFGKPIPINELYRRIRDKELIVSNKSL